MLLKSQHMFEFRCVYAHIPYRHEGLGATEPEHAVNGAKSDLAIDVTEHIVRPLDLSKTARNTALTLVSASKLTALCTCHWRLSLIGNVTGLEIAVCMIT